jgi:hypothetical protein
MATVIVDELAIAAPLYKICPPIAPVVKATVPFAVHVAPFPEYPLLHAHVLVAAPVDVQVACASQPPWLIRHEFDSVHAMPVPEYPGLHAQE